MTGPIKGQMMMMLQTHCEGGIFDGDGGLKRISWGGLTLVMRGRGVAQKEGLQLVVNKVARAG